MTTYAYNIETFSVFKEKVYNKMEKEKNIAFQLKYDLIKNTRYQNFQKDFTFVVNGKEYQTSKFVADLLSPKIGRLHEIDETMCYFSFDTIHEGDFQILLDLVNFEPKNFSTDEIDFLNESLFSLGNVEYLALNPIFNEPITLQNVTLRIQQKLFYKKPLNDQTINYDAYQIITDEISFLASHFYEYADKREEKFEEISKLDVTSISMILNDPALKISNEDSLMLFIIDLFKKNSWQFTEDFIRLMEWVQFENLSNNSMNKFVEVFNLDFMNTQIWTSLIKRLILPRANEALNSPFNKYDRYRIKQLPLTYGLVNDGVFNYLRSKFNRDPIDSGLVGVTASSS